MTRSLQIIHEHCQLRAQTDEATVIDEVEFPFILAFKVGSILVLLAYRFGKTASKFLFNLLRMALNCFHVLTC